MQPSTTVDFCFGVGSRYSYLAATQLGGRLFWNNDRLPLLRHAPLRA